MSRLWRLRVLWLTAAVALATLATDTSVLADRLAKPPLPMSVAVEQHLVKEAPKAAARRVAKRDAAVKAMFERRAAAILHDDRAAFLADVDPRELSYRSEQDIVFDSIHRIGFDSWSYEPKRDASYSPTSIDFQKYLLDDDVWLPVLILRYRIKGFDTLSVGRRVVYTVTKHDGRWWIASDSDLDKVTSSGTSVRVDPWENGRLVVDRTPRALVLGHPEDADAVGAIRDAVDAAVRHVVKYVGSAGWNDKVVIVLPKDKDETNQVLENPQTFFDFAAIAKPLQTISAIDDSPRAYAGARVVINPDGFEPDSKFTKTLLRHEITHVALFQRTGPMSPKWLVEGIAEYVGNAESTLSVRAIAGDLSAAMPTRDRPNTLPGDSDFGLLDNAGDAYGLSWSLCRYIVARYGRAAMFRFYDEMGNLDGIEHPGSKLDDALRHVLHTDEDTLIHDWRPFARASVGPLAHLVAKPPAPYVESDQGDASIPDLAELTATTAAALTALGIDRGYAGLWYQGGESAPSRFVSETLLVGHDDASAAKVERAVAAHYTRFDRGIAVPHGRLYRVRATLHSGTYNLSVVVMRIGIVTVEVRVGYRSGDPTAEARRQAALEYAAVA